MATELNNGQAEGATEEAALGYMACLEHMQALAGELRCAMDAIGANEAWEFSASVARQRELAGDWQGSLAQVCNASRALRAEWRPRVEQAARALYRLHLEYAALIEYSRQSMRMLAQLRPGSESAAAEETSWSVSA